MLVHGGSSAADGAEKLAQRHQPATGGRQRQKTAQLSAVLVVVRRARWRALVTVDGHVMRCHHLLRRHPHRRRGCCLAASVTAELLLLLLLLLLHWLRVHVHVLLHRRGVVGLATGRHHLGCRLLWWLALPAASNHLL